MPVSQLVNEVAGVMRPAKQSLANNPAKCRVTTTGTRVEGCKSGVALLDAGEDEDSAGLATRTQYESDAKRVIHLSYGYHAVLWERHSSVHLLAPSILAQHDQIQLPTAQPETLFRKATRHLLSTEPLKPAAVGQCPH